MRLPSALTLFAIAMAVLSGAARGEPLRIRAAYIVPGTNIASIMSAKPELTKHAGVSYILEPVRFQGTPPMITALAVNEIDIGLLGYSSIGLAVQNAGMSDLRVFADEFQDGVDGHRSNEFMVRADSAIKKIEDLKGKVLATNNSGSAVDIAMRAMLRKAGLEDKRDYTVVEASLAAAKALLSDKKVDLVTAVPPFSFDKELRAISRTLFTQRDAMGPSELGFWVAHGTFLTKNKAAVLDFLEDTLVVTRWYMDPKNHDEAVKIAAAAAKAPPALFADWLFTKDDYYRDPNLMPNMAAFQANMDLQVQAGMLNTRIDVKAYTDLSYVEEAAKRLK